MLTIHSIQEIRAQIKQLKLQGKTIGFVPTMGALHEGHLSLIRKSNSENDHTVCSIYVNPTQFNNPDDLLKYPKTLEQDARLLENAGCSLLFLPDNFTMYPEAAKTSFGFGELERAMEGRSRPGHFSGVGLVVSKLFNIVQPRKAYFGQKDFQQCLVIQQMAKDLFFDIEIEICPTVRDEKDGLAMSSRNLRLQADERQQAPALFRALQTFQNGLQQGQSVKQAKEKARMVLAEYPAMTIDYLEAVDRDTNEVLSETDKKTGLAVCGALYLGQVRLIDNLVF